MSAAIRFTLSDFLLADNGMYTDGHPKSIRTTDMSTNPNETPWEGNMGAWPR